MAKVSKETVKIGKLLQGVTTRTPASGKEAGSALPNTLTSYFNKSIQTLRSSGQLLEAIRTLARVHPETSMTVSTITRLANTNLRMRVYDEAHQLSAEGSDLLRSVLNRMTLSSDYTYGFDDRPSLTALTESLLRSITLTGASALELVLDKQRLPFRFQPVSPEWLKFKVSQSGDKIIPYQTVSGVDVELDVPTFFYEAMDADLTSAYPVSPLESAINIAINSTETLEDMRRAIKRSGHSRLAVKLLTEELLKSAPLSVRADPEKLAAWVEGERAAVQAELENLSPESALVFFSAMEIDYLNSEIGGTSDYASLVETLDGILATSLKIPLAALGKRSSSGSQNTTSTESLLYLKMAQGLHNPVQSILSRAMTLALRLYGFSGYVKCQFDSIDLRPDIELEAYRSMFQARVMELISVGMLSDQEGAELLNTGPRAPGAPTLSGTMFYGGNTSSLVAPVTKEDPARQSMTAKTPTAGGGKSKGA